MEKCHSLYLYNKLMKTCTLCGIEKELSEFSKDKHRKDGFTDRCKCCRNTAQKKYLVNAPEVFSKIKAKRASAAKKFYSTKKGKDKLREYHLQKEFSMSIEDYNSLLEKQDGVCNICKRHRIASNKSNMAVDHCHTTGKIRGILCNWCNRGIGIFEDNEEFLKRAIDYLKESKNDI